MLRLLLSVNGICAYPVYVLLIYCASTSFVFAVNEHKVERAMKNYEGRIYAPNIFHLFNYFILHKKRKKMRSAVFIIVVYI